MSRTFEIVCKFNMNLRNDPKHPFHIGKEAFEYPRADVFMKQDKFTRREWNDQPCMICLQEGPLNKEAAQTNAQQQNHTVISNQECTTPGAAESMETDSKKATEAEVQARKDAWHKRRIPSAVREAKKRRKLQAEALCNSPEALREQRRLLAEARERQQ